MASKWEKEVLVLSESSIKWIVEAQRILDTIKTSDDKSQNDKNLKNVLSFLKSKNAKINWDWGNIWISVSSWDEGDYNNIKTTLNVLLQMEKIKINPDTSEIALVEPPLSENPTQNAALELTTTLTEVKLAQLKSDIESWKLTNLLFLEILRAMSDPEKISPKDKPLILSLLFSELNKKWINIWFNWDKANNNWKIKLTASTSLIKDKTVENKPEQVALEYENMLNLHLWETFDRWDILKAFLFRTRAVDEYLDWYKDVQKDKEKYKDENKAYVVYLLRKYNILNWFKITSTWVSAFDLFESNWDIFVDWEDAYKYLIADIKARMKGEKNIQNRDFLIAYFTDQFYASWKNTPKDMVTEYKENKKDIDFKMVQTYASLSTQQLYALHWDSSPDVLKQKEAQFKKDPIWFLKEAMNNWWIAWILIWMLFWWIIWSIFWIWFKKWALWWGLLWFWSAVLWSEWVEQIFNKSKLSVEELLKNVEKDTSGVRKKYSSILSENELPDSRKLTRIYAWILNNEKFRNSPSSSINIFLNNKWSENYQKILDYFKSIWIELTDDDKDYYEYIFTEIKKQRDADWINDISDNEKMIDYLKKTKKTQKEQEDKQEDKPEESDTPKIKTLSEKISEIKDNNVITPVIKAKLWSQKLSTIQSLISDDTKLSAFFQAMGIKAFYDTHKDNLKLILTELVNSESDKNKKISEILK